MCRRRASRPTAMSARRLSSWTASSPIRSSQDADCQAMVTRPAAAPTKQAPAIPCSTEIGCAAVRASSARARIVARHHTMPGRRRLRLAAQRGAIVVQRARDLDQIGADLARRRRAPPDRRTGPASGRTRPPRARPPRARTRSPHGLASVEGTGRRGGAHRPPPRRRPASRRRARNSSSLMLAVFSPSVSAISLCDEPCA